MSASRRRVDIKAILADPTQREELFVSLIQATQAREGILTTEAQARTAYRKIASANKKRTT